MKIKFLRPVQGMAYFEGDVCDIDDKRGASLVRSGFVILIPDTEGTVNRLPEDMPAREILFDNGMETLEDVRKALNVLTDFDGIGKRTAEKVRKYCEMGQ